MGCKCFDTRHFKGFTDADVIQKSSQTRKTTTDTGTFSQSGLTTAFDIDNEQNSFIITNGTIYTSDESRPFIENGYLIVKNGVISDIGKGVPHTEPQAQVIKGKGKLILPGFINPHWHESFVAPCTEKADDSDLEPTPYSQGGNIEALSSMFAFISSVGNKLSDDEALAIARWSMWTQLRAGTTTLGDVGSANKPDAMALAAIDLGMRLRVSRWGSDIMIANNGNTFTRIADTEAQADDWYKLLEKWDGHSSGLVGGMPSVMGAFGSSDEQLASLKTVTDKFDCPYATHLAPLRNEREAVTRVFGRSPIQRFDDFGLLTDRLLAVHTAYATDAEYRLLLERGVHICHSPAHYGMLGETTLSETKQLTRFLGDGVPLSTSTDGGITFIGGMPEALRAAHLGHNEIANSNTACPPNLALRTGTLHGAVGLGWSDRIGSLEVGKQADLVMINIDDWRYRLGNHPLRTFLVAGSSRDVDTVIVAGRTLLRDGRSMLFNEDELYSDYQQAATSARKRLAPSSHQ